MQTYNVSTSLWKKNWNSNYVGLYVTNIEKSLHIGSGALAELFFLYSKGLREWVSMIQKLL